VIIQNWRVLRNIFHANTRTRLYFIAHHPYEYLSTGLRRFVKEASRDRMCKRIKITLYRTLAGTKIVQYLIDAALNATGCVVVELKARFDESANY